MTDRTLRVSLPEDIERGKRWISAAFRACELHDTLTDLIKIFHNIDLDTGCRSTVYYSGQSALQSRPCPVVMAFKEAYSTNGHSMKLKDCLMMV
jgi:hypothetical protein